MNVGSHDGRKYDEKKNSFLQSENQWSETNFLPAFNKSVYLNDDLYLEFSSS